MPCLSYNGRPRKGILNPESQHIQQRIVTIPHSITITLTLKGSGKRNVFFSERRLLIFGPDGEMERDTKNPTRRIPERLLLKKLIENSLNRKSDIKFWEYPDPRDEPPGTWCQCRPIEDPEKRKALGIIEGPPSFYCAYCDNEIDSDDPRQIYCNNECRKKAYIKWRKRKNSWAKKPTRTCETCGGVIEGNQKQRFCGDQCRQRAHRKKIKPVPAPSQQTQ